MSQGTGAWGPTWRIAGGGIKWFCIVTQGLLPIPGLGDSRKAGQGKRRLAASVAGKFPCRNPISSVAASVCQFAGIASLRPMRRTGWMSWRCWPTGKPKPTARINAVAELAELRQRRPGPGGPGGPGRGPWQCWSWWRWIGVGPGCGPPGPARPWWSWWRWSWWRWNSGGPGQPRPGPRASWRSWWRWSWWTTARPWWCWSWWRWNSGGPGGGPAPGPGRSEIICCDGPEKLFRPRPRGDPWPKIPKHGGAIGGGPLQCKTRY